MFEEINKSTVYGPVKSWRFGMSLGIDPIFIHSVCSFNCTYCQLGNIQEVTNERREFISTKLVLDDYQSALSGNEKIDVITYSGSGEPTLATNLGDMIKGIKKISPSIPQYILTNGTLLGDSNVIKDLLLLDKVTIKLDAIDDSHLGKINRPANGVNFSNIWKGILKFREQYKGDIEVQVMLMPMSKLNIEEFSKRLTALNPKLIQVNTPKRPYPLSWHRENRGNHKKIFNYKVSELKTVSKEEAEDIVSELKNRTGLEFQIFS